jgi:hypothetical protein
MRTLGTCITGYASPNLPEMAMHSPLSGLGGTCSNLHAVTIRRLVDGTQASSHFGRNIGFQLINVSAWTIIFRRIGFKVAVLQSLRPMDPSGTRPSSASQFSMP